MNRRNATTAIAAAMFGATALSASAQSGRNTEMLTQLIVEVINDGDMSNLEEIVTPGVTIAILGINKIEEFRDASIEGHESRQEQYSEYSFEIQSIAENEDWCHALVRFEGTEPSGRMEVRSVFYVAQFRDGLIHNLYLG